MPKQSALQQVGNETASATPMTRRESCVALAMASARRILNGRDMTGWRKTGRGLWTVEDGATTGRFDPSGPVPVTCSSDREYAGFRFANLEFWISKHGNHQPIEAVCSSVQCGKPSRDREEADGRVRQLKFGRDLLKVRCPAPWHKPAERAQLSPIPAPP